LEEYYYYIYIYIYIYITRLASNEIFSPSNKIHREVGRAKDLSAPAHTDSRVLYSNANLKIGNFFRSQWWIWLFHYIHAVLINTKHNLKLALLHIPPTKYTNFISHILQYILILNEHLTHFISLQIPTSLMAVKLELKNVWERTILKYSYVHVPDDCMLLVANNDWQSQRSRLQPLITTPTVSTFHDRFWQIRLTGQLPHISDIVQTTLMSVTFCLSLHETQYFHVWWDESHLKSPYMSQRCHCIIKHWLARLCAIGGYLISILLVPRKFMESKMRFTTKMDSNTTDSVAPTNHKYKKPMPASRH
jgi:hypothetical protein